MLDPRIPPKIAHLAGQPPRLKIDKLVVSSCNGSEINRRDGLTRAWNHFRVPFCPNGRTGRTRIEIVSLFTGILSKLGFGRGQKFFHVFLPFPLLFPTNTFGSLLRSLFGWITIGWDWKVKRNVYLFLEFWQIFDRKSKNEFRKEIVRRFNLWIS